MDIRPKRRIAIIALFLGAIAMGSVPADARGSGRPSSRGGKTATSIQGAGGAHKSDNKGNKVNNGNINIGNDVNIDVDNDWGYHHIDHPVAVGIAVGVTTAIVVGARTRVLPTGCVVYPYATLYYHCAGYYYSPVYSGTTVEYVVVVKPD